MTDDTRGRRERAKALLMEAWHRSQTQPDYTHKTLSQWLEECEPIIASALAEAERRVWEEAAKLCEAEALIDDERGYYGKEMAKVIRAKAAE